MDQDPTIRVLGWSGTARSRAITQGDGLSPFARAATCAPVRASPTPAPVDLPAKPLPPSHASVWFWVEATVRPVAEIQRTLPPLADGIVSVRDLARLTGRHVRAVLQAVRDGRLQRADVSRRYGVCVAASGADVLAWRARTFSAVLAAARIDRPALPPDDAGWRTVHAVAAASGLSYATTYRRLCAIGRPQLTWDADTPFRAQRRVHLPVGDEPTLAAGAVLGTSAGGGASEG
jgi:hypothetical protein